MNMLYVFVASRNLLLPLFDAHPIITPSNYSRYIHLSPQHNSTMVGELPDIPQCFDDKISTCPLKNPTYCYSSIVQSPHFFSVFFWQIKTTYGRFFRLQPTQEAQEPKTGGGAWSVWTSVLVLLSFASICSSSLCAARACDWCFFWRPPRGGGCHMNRKWVKKTVIIYMEYPQLYILW